MRSTWQTRDASIGELFDSHPDIEVDNEEYKRLLGYPNHHVLEGRAAELADWARQWYSENGRPWVYARRAESLDVTNGQIRIEDVEFSSKRLRKQLADAQASSAYLVAVSAGQGCEAKARELWLEGKPDEYFFLEVFGSAVVEHLITVTGARFCAWADQKGLAVLPYYSPGYSGWNISDQGKLLNLILRKRSRDFHPEIHVLDTGMLQPKKSLLAVFGLTENLGLVQNLAEMIPCERCPMPSCQYRRMPYKYSRSQIEDVRLLQSRRNGTGDGKPQIRAALDHNANYSFSTRALRKWSDERLHLKVSRDRSVQASFRYEGTTCSNLGQPLLYDYQVKVSSAREGYKIVAMNCSPAAGDKGYTYMCQYASNPKSLISAIENEKPLLGRPLNDILSWQRRPHPAGCYCDAVSREHKWGLALEVIHYALVQLEKENDENL